MSLTVINWYFMSLLLVQNDVDSSAASMWWSKEFLINYIIFTHVKTFKFMCQMYWERNDPIMNSILFKLVILFFVLKYF